MKIELIKGFVGLAMSGAIYLLSTSMVDQFLRYLYIGGSIFMLLCAAYFFMLYFRNLYIISKIKKQRKNMDAGDIYYD